MQIDALKTVLSNKTEHTTCNIDPINITLHKHAKHAWEKIKYQLPRTYSHIVNNTPQKQDPQQPSGSRGTHTYSTFHQTLSIKTMFFLVVFIAKFLY